MKNIIARGLIAAGLLVWLGTTSLAAQSTGSTSTVLAQDTTCYTGAVPLGDSSQARQPQVWTDSAGLNKPRGPKNCGNMSRTAMQVDSACRATRATCPQPMGAGVGSDGLKWQAPPDSVKPRKP